MSILKYKLPYNIMRTLYLSLADSIILYGISSYGRTYKTYMEQIHKLQITLLKTIVPNKIRKSHKDDNNDLFQHCKVINTYNRFRLSLLVEECSIISSLRQKSRPNQLRSLDYLPTYLLPCNKKNLR